MIEDPELDRILSLAEALPFEKLELLVGELIFRRRERWAAELQADVEQARDDLRTGKLKPEPLETILQRLHAVAEADEE